MIVLCVKAALNNIYLEVNLLPGAIIFVNSDTHPNVLSVLAIQLYIDETIDGYEFNQRSVTDPNYLDIIHEQFLRVLVTQDASDQTNHNLADVVLYIKAGLASIEKNRIGPPSLTLPVSRVTLEELLSVPNSPTITFIPAGVQNNITVSLFPPKTPDLFPFGSSPVIAPGGSGKLVKIATGTDHNDED